MLSPMTSPGPGLSGEPRLHGVAQPLVDPGLRLHRVDVGMHGVSPFPGFCWVSTSLRRVAAQNIGTLAGIALPIEPHGGGRATGAPRGTSEGHPGDSGASASWPMMSPAEPA